MLTCSPLNRSLCVKDLNENFEEMGINLFQAIIDSARVFPAADQKLAQINKQYSDSIILLYRVFFQGSEQSVISSLLPTLLATIQDQSLVHSVSFFTEIYSLFSIFAQPKLVEEIISLLQSLIFTCRYLPTLRFYLYLYSATIKYYLKPVEQIKKAISIIIPCTLR